MQIGTRKLNCSMPRCDFMYKGPQTPHAKKVLVRNRAPKPGSFLASTQYVCALSVVTR